MFSKETSPANVLANASGKFSRNVLIIILLWFSIVPFTKKWDNPLSWDVFGYYLYTPAAVLWHDPALKDFSKAETINNKYENTGTYYQGGKTENGSWMIKYTMGLALLESPFFLAAHLYASKAGYPADGFSLPYQTAMYFAHFIYVLIGFIFLRKALLRLFSDKITACLLLLVTAGTNYYAMAMLVRGITPIHALEFSLISLLLFLTILMHEAPSKKRAALLGLVFGFIVLVRPSDILIIIIPLMWGVGSFKKFKEKILALIKGHIAEVLLFAAAAFAVLLPQMLYWKLVSGSYLLFSYNNNPGEGFEFLHPYIVQTLFSFRKGWLVYTPLMLFSIAGLWSLYKNNRGLFMPVILFFILNIYLISSWSCWWYAGCFGQRALVDSYPVMLIPFGCFLNEMAEMSNKLFKYCCYTLITLFVLLNIFQTWQYEHRIIDGSRMTKAYYFRTFGKTSVSYDDKKLLLLNRGEAIFTNEYEYNSHVLFSENFEDAAEAQKKQCNDSIVKSGKYSLQLDSVFNFSANKEAAFFDITKKDHAWIRCSGWYFAAAEMTNNELDLVVTFVNHKGYLYNYIAADVMKITKGPVKAGQWNKFTLDYLTPEVRSVSDKINIYFWYRGKRPVYVDDLKAEVFEKK